jgi:hypothetical protein
VLDERIEGLSGDFPAQLPFFPIQNLSARMDAIID